MPRPDPKPGKKKKRSMTADKAEFTRNSHTAWQRDGGKCVYCGAFIPEGKPAHHQIGAGLGGRRCHHPSNLLTSCDHCHDNHGHGIRRVTG